MIRKWIHTICLALCVLLCAFLIGRVIFHTDTPLHTPNTVVQRAARTETDAERKITLDSGALTTLLIRQLPNDFVLENLSIQITDQGTLWCTADIVPDALSLPRAASLLLPDPCSLAAIVSIGYTDDEIVLHPLSLEIGGIKLPHTILSPIAEELADSLTEGLRAQGIYLQSLYIEDGQLSIALKP